MSEKPSLCSTGEHCQLWPELTSLKQEIKALSELVSTDALTHLPNYRYFTQVITQEIERSQRTGQPTTLIMIDADHFKRVNDNWGHETGNQALQLIGNSIKSNIRKLDIACRYGGEEFAVILPSTDSDIAIHVAERIRVSIENAQLLSSDTEQVIPLTVSLGLSTYTYKRHDNWHQLVERADKELYRAKEQGRNQVCYTDDQIKDQQVSEEEKSALFDMFKPKKIS